MSEELKGRWLYHGGDIFIVDGVAKDSDSDAEVVVYWHPLRSDEKLFLAKDKFLRRFTPYPKLKAPKK